jgi:HK97 family phage major capsid protein
VINNNAANKRGLLNVTGINAVTFTSGSPTVALLYPKIADAINQVNTQRFLPADAIVMHPRRWAWMASALDAGGRPLLVPQGGGPFNAVGTGPAASPNPTVGLVGTLLGLPVYVDPNIPTNLGAGTNEDRIIVARFGDSVLWESTPKAEVFPATKADQLSVLLRVYEYVAFTGERYPKATSVISGTGLTPPTF